MSGDHKFRICCKLSYQGQSKSRDFEFHYPSLQQARTNYKSILLSLYRRRNLKSFQICLNRSRSKKWEAAIYKEAVQNLR